MSAQSTTVTIVVNQHQLVSSGMQQMLCACKQARQMQSKVAGRQWYCALRSTLHPDQAGRPKDNAGLVLFVLSTRSYPCSHAKKGLCVATTWW